MVLIVSHRTVNVSLVQWYNVEHGSPVIQSPLGIRSGPPSFRALLSRGLCSCQTVRLLVHGYADNLQLYDHVAPSESMSHSLTVLRQLRCGWPLAGCVLIPLRVSSSGLVPPGTFTSDA